MYILKYLLIFFLKIVNSTSKLNYYTHNLSEISLSQCVGEAIKRNFSVTLPIAFGMSSSNADSVTFLLDIVYKNQDWPFKLLNNSKPKYRDPHFMREERSAIFEIENAADVLQSIEYIKEYHFWQPLTKILFFSTKYIYDKTPALVEMFEYSWKQFSGDVIVILPDNINSTIFKIYSFFPYNKGLCGNVYTEDQVIEIGSCENGIMSPDNIILFGNKIPNNLNRCTINAHYVDWPPYTFLLDNYSMGYTHNYTNKGIDPNLLNILADRINISVRYIVTNRFLDWGNIGMDGIPLGNMIPIREEFGDVAIGAYTHGISTRTFLQGTSETIQAELRLCVPHLPIYHGLSTLLEITSTAILCLLPLTLAILTALIFLSTVGRNEFTAYSNITNCILNIWSIILGVSAVLPKTFATRIVMTVLLFYGFYFNIYFQTYLVSVLSDRSYIEEIQIVEDCIDYDNYIIPESLNFFAALTDDPRIYNAISKNSINCSDQDACLRRISLYKNSTFLATSNYVSANYRLYLVNKTLRSSGGAVRCINDFITSYYNNLLLKKSFPFIKPLNWIVAQCHSAGLYDKWDRMFVPMRRAFNSLVFEPFDYLEPDDFSTDLNLKSLKPILMLWIYGMSISSSVIILELAVYHAQSKKMFFILNRKNI